MITIITVLDRPSTRLILGCPEFIPQTLDYLVKQNKAFLFEPWGADIKDLPNRSKAEARRAERIVGKVVKLYNLQPYL